MKKETLDRANYLIQQIDKCQKQIKFFEYTQCENVLERESKIQFNSSFDYFGIIPDKLYRTIGKILLNEWKLYLIELQNELEEL